MFNSAPSLSLIRSWKDVSAEWKKLRRDFSERTIHDLRVATRRMIADLEVATAVTGSRKAYRLNRKFKKVLERLGPLRDVQVHLLNSRRGTSVWTSTFSAFLKQREAEEIRRLRKRMQEETRKGFRRDVWNTNRKLKSIEEGISRPVLRAAIQANIDKKITSVLLADARFRRTSSNEDLHRMRVQFKRLRYAAEVAKPIIGGFTNLQMQKMRKLLKAMGEIHDLQTYMTALAEWSGRKPPLELQKKHDVLMTAFKARPALTEEFNFRNRP